MDDIERMDNQAEACKLKLGFRGISVCSWPGLTAQEVAQRVKELRARRRQRVLMNPEMRQSTAGRIRRAGTQDRHPFDLVQTFWDGHWTLTLPDPTTPEDWRLLDEAFDPPEPNPVGQKAYGNA